MLCFLFKQNTANEMRISYRSSDVCSSDLTYFANQLSYSTCRHITLHRVRRLPLVVYGVQAKSCWWLQLWPWPAAQAIPASNTLTTKRTWCRTEERRVGKDGVSTCSYRGSP